MFGGVGVGEFVDYVLEVVGGFGVVVLVVVVVYVD